MASPELKGAIAAARTDLSFRSSIEEREIIVAQVKRTEWPDAGLGCPEPGARYEPQPTDGYLIVLDSFHWEYEYHADATGRIVYCGRRKQG